MEFRLRPLGFMEFFLQNNNHQAVNKMPDDCCFVKKLHETQRSPSKFHIYIYVYIYLLLLYNSSILDIEHSILDIEHSPYYIPLGSRQTHKVI